ncbi:MAG: deoxyguanosinetriphosphate triphosphohydrolase [Nitrospinae bacterium]|nr:deoxyguanosinetriphosphate triphosphohydrolase [Nitrospinota bacterium]
MTREDFEIREAKNLAPYAMKSRDSAGRKYPEEEHPFRTAFQRDRDRVVHSSSFRRLEYKTQVFVYHEGDYYRTRLTHTIEVSQIARTIARSLGLNEDLAEAVALAHDLGHPPFGHSGEKALNELMKDHRGFEHNRQSLRLVVELEHKYPDFPGLNLSAEVREGLEKHSTDYDHPVLSEEQKKAAPTMEALVVDYADGIAYNSHDLDDGVTSDMIDVTQLENIALWRENIEKTEASSPKLEFKMKKYQVVRMIINQQVTDLIQQTQKNIQERNVDGMEKVRSQTSPLVSFSPSMQKKNQELKDFLKKYLYRHYRVNRMENKAIRIINKLFTAYVNQIELLPQFPDNIPRNISRERLVCDYIAGMTDRFALSEMKKLFDPNEKV